LTSATAAFCFVRGLPVLLGSWSYIAGNLASGRGGKISAGDVG
jgi:hypothetical protein